MSKMTEEQVIEAGKKYLIDNKDRVENVINTGSQYVIPDFKEDWKERILSDSTYRAVNMETGEPKDPIASYEYAMDMMIKLHSGEMDIEKAAELLDELIKTDRSLWRDVFGHLGAYTDYAQQITAVNRAKRDGTNQPNN